MPPDFDLTDPASPFVGRITFGPGADLVPVPPGLSIQPAEPGARLVFDPLPPLVIDLAEPDPVPAGDPVPGHLFEPCFWPAPVGPVLRADRCRPLRPAAAAAARARATPDPEPRGWSLSLAFALVAILSGLALLLAAWFAHRFPLPPAL